MVGGSDRLDHHHGAKTEYRQASSAVKSNSLAAILNPAVVGTDDNITLLDLPEPRYAPPLAEKSGVVTCLSRCVFWRGPVGSCR
jgi:hypothetical protein